MSSGPRTGGLLRGAGGYHAAAVRDFYAPLADASGAPLYAPMLRWRHRDARRHAARAATKAKAQGAASEAKAAVPARNSAAARKRDDDSDSDSDSDSDDSSVEAAQTSSRRRGGMDDASLMKALHRTVGAGRSGSGGGEAYIPGTSLEEFTVQDELGRGAHGIVYKAVSKRDGRTYVIKQVSVKRMKDKQRRNAVAEVLILRRLNHPNIVQYYNCFVQNQTLCIVMEYASKGDLYTIIETRRRSKKYYGERTLWRYFWQLCQGLVHLHSKRIVHRDLKTLNIFLTEGGRIKIGDLGVSRILGRDSNLESRVGTPLYLAPELIRQQPYSYKVDIWSLGCVIYTLAALQPPFRGENLLALAQVILHKKPKPLPPFYTKSLRVVVASMLEKVASKRPTITQVIDSFPSHLKTQLAREDPPVPVPQRHRSAHQGTSHVTRHRATPTAAVASKPTSVNNSGVATPAVAAAGGGSGGHATADVGAPTAVPFDGAPPKPPRPAYRRRGSEESRPPLPIRPPSALSARDVQPSKPSAPPQLPVTVPSLATGAAAPAPALAAATSARGATSTPKPATAVAAAPAAAPAPAPAPAPAWARRVRPASASLARGKRHRSKRPSIAALMSAMAPTASHTVAQATTAPRPSAVKPQPASTHAPRASSPVRAVCRAVVGTPASASEPAPTPAPAPVSARAPTAKAVRAWSPVTGAYFASGGTTVSRGPLSARGRPSSTVATSHRSARARPLSARRQRHVSPDAQRVPATAREPHGGQPHGGQPHRGQPHGGQPHGGQPHGGQPHGGQPHGQHRGQHRDQPRSVIAAVAGTASRPSDTAAGHRVSSGSTETYPPKATADVSHATGTNALRGTRGTPAAAPAVAPAVAAAVAPAVPVGGAGNAVRALGRREAPSSAARSNAWAGTGAESNARRQRYDRVRDRPPTSRHSRASTHHRPASATLPQRQRTADHSRGRRMVASVPRQAFGSDLQRFAAGTATVRVRVKQFNPRDVVVRDRRESGEQQRRHRRPASAWTGGRRPYGAGAERERSTHHRRQRQHHQPPQHRRADGVSRRNGWAR